MKQSCNNCRFWSQMIAQSVGLSPIEALCLGEGKHRRRYTTGHMTCDGWKDDHFGKVDDPPDYGEAVRAAYAKEEQAAK